MTEIFFLAECKRGEMGNGMRYADHGRVIRRSADTGWLLGKTMKGRNKNERNKGIAPAESDAV